MIISIRTPGNIQILPDENLLFIIIWVGVKLILFRQLLLPRAKECCPTNYPKTYCDVGGFIVRGSELPA